MSESASPTVQVLEIPNWHQNVACSGTGHYSGVDKHLHGDPSQPAEWMVKHQCPECKTTLVRPVCDFFKENGTHPDRMVTCTKCKFKDSAAIFFTVLHRL